ncbi:MAG: RNA-guided endonuclease InsQ/TnpB family protein [Chroococcidiopsis sp.]
MTQALTVRCKLIVPIEFCHQIDETLRGFANACNYILDVAKQEKCWNTTKLHHKVYKATRELTGLKANHVCQAIRRVVGNAKAVKQIHKFRPTSISLDARTFKYVEDKQFVGVTLKSGRVNLDLAIGGYQIALLRGQVPTSATLSKTRQGDYYINIVVEIPTQPAGKTPRVLGVDLGRRDIATTSTGKTWNGKQLKETRAKYARMRASIQSKRSKASKRLLRRLSGKERRFQAWINHNISKQLVCDAKDTAAAIAFEDLTGIRQTAKVRKSQKREHNSWAFYQLRLFTEYKAIVAGIPIVLVDPRYTSKTCNCCKVIGNRDGKVFRCLNLKCGWIGDADHNGALNISALGAAVNQPGISTMFCSLQDVVRDKAPTIASA